MAQELSMVLIPALGNTLGVYFVTRAIELGDKPKVSAVVSSMLKVCGLNDHRG